MTQQQNRVAPQPHGAAIAGMRHEASMSVQYTRTSEIGIGSDNGEGTWLFTDCSSFFIVERLSSITSCSFDIKLVGSAIPTELWRLFFSCGWC